MFTQSSKRFVVAGVVAGVAACVVGVESPLNETVELFPAGGWSQLPGTVLKAVGRRIRTIRGAK